MSGVHPTFESAKDEIAARVKQLRADAGTAQTQAEHYAQLSERESATAARCRKLADDYQELLDHALFGANAPKARRSPRTTPKA